MLFHFLIRIAEHPPKADKSAMGAINRPLQLVGCICQHALTGSIIGTYEALVVYYRSPLIPASTLLTVRDDRSHTVPQCRISPAEDCRVDEREDNNYQGNPREEI